MIVKAALIAAILGPASRGQLVELRDGVPALCEALCKLLLRDQLYLELEEQRVAAHERTW